MKYFLLLSLQSAVSAEMPAGHHHCPMLQLEYIFLISQKFQLWIYVSQFSRVHSFMPSSVLAIACFFVCGSPGPVSCDGSGGSEANSTIHHLSSSKSIKGDLWPTACVQSIKNSTSCVESGFAHSSLLSSSSTTLNEGSNEKHNVDVLRSMTRVATRTSSSLPSSIHCTSLIASWA